jgi:hypothetical protein
MLACHTWLCVDFFVRAGFTLHATPDSHRWAVRDNRSHEIPSECGHADCPAHPTAMIELKEAA